MKRGASTLIACAAVAVAAGCGSSGSSTGGSASTSTPTAGTSTPAGSSTPAVKSGGLKPSTTPKFAAPSPSAPISSGIVPIAYRSIAIAPDTLRVKVGSTIKWTNYDAVEHNVTSEGGPQSFASKNFGEGKTFEVKVTKPGVIHYECTIHPASMNGAIEVVK
ncbi:MAG: plastocyanin/azurin family copper-binding protein [Solirubrobacterales bacterium]